MYCTKCGNALKDEDLFCSKCGTAVHRQAESVEPSVTPTQSATNDNMVFRSEDLKRLRQILAETEEETIPQEREKETPSMFGNMKDKFLGKIAENKVKKTSVPEYQEESYQVPEDVADPFLTGYISPDELKKQLKTQGIIEQEKEKIRKKSKNYSKLFLRIVIIGVIVGAVFGMIINLTLGLI